MSKSPHVHFAKLIAEAEPLPAIPTAVVAPEEANSLGGALLGRDATLIDPILVGCQKKITAAAAELGADITDIPILDEPDHGKAAHLGVSLVHEGRATCVMKGHLHTGKLLGAVFKREGGLRTGRKLTHCFVTDVPGHDRLLIITDAAINIVPDFDTKVDIVKNAIDLSQALGTAEPNVAIMTAVETVNPDIPATMDAAALAKMADRGQIKGGKVDGPFAMDNAVSLEAAQIKGINSPVAGKADVLVAPSMEAGNMLVKALTFLAGGLTGGLVLGAQVPVILTSRADNDDARRAACALAVHYVNKG